MASMAAWLFSIMHANLITGFNTKLPLLYKTTVHQYYWFIAIRVVFVRVWKTLGQRKFLRTTYYMAAGIGRAKEWRCV